MVISRSYPQTLRAHRLQRDAERPDARRRQPDDLDHLRREQPGQHLPHGPTRDTGSAAAGILVNGNGRYLRNEYGLKNSGPVLQKSSETQTRSHNGQGTDNTGDGLYVQGDGNVLTDVDAFSESKGHGFHVVGHANQLLKLDAGDKGKGNAGDGIHVVGSGNLVL